jgi:adenosylcobinamide-phosphate synthase
MTFWGALLALLWDQLSPLHRPSQFDRLFARYSDWVLEHFNAGTRAHGILAWAVAALLPAFLAGLAGALFGAWSHLLGLAWASAVLFQCMGFRQLTNKAEAIKKDLTAGDAQRARETLSDLGLPDTASVADAELTRVAIVQVLEAGLRRTFGVLLWFTLLGPFGAIAYALTIPLAIRWRGDTDFRAVIGSIMDLLDWLPVRLLALSFAIVGNFEEALLAWRSRTADGLSAGTAGLTAAGLGALGLDGAKPDPDYVTGAAALLKRTALAWLALLGLFWLGGM